MGRATAAMASDWESPAFPDAGRRVPAAAPAFRFHEASPDLIGRLAAEWQALAAGAAEPNPYREPWFAAASIRHLPAEGVMLAELRQDGALLGVMLLGVEPRYGRMPVAHVENWWHHHLFLGTPLVRSGSEALFWEQLIRGLDSESWAPGFFHVRDLVEGGAMHRALEAAAAALGRPARIVYRETRALLESPLGAEQYFAQAIRKKKRKELARLRNRLAELGPLATRALGPLDDLGAWCDDFLRLERSGWKGQAGSALACRAETEAFFRDALAGARAAGRLHFLRMDLGGQPVAMLINFLSPPGGFSFKTAFDESYARFSPGVLLQVDNLAILDRHDIAWMDSCAAEQHPMIEHLWRERRALVRVTVPLAGARRRAVHGLARLLEQASAARRTLFSRRGGTTGEAG